VLNKFLTKELHTIPVLSQIALSLLGCMYLASQPSRHPSGLKVQELRTQSKKLIKAHHHCNRWAMKKLNKQHSLLTEATVPQSILTNLISSHEIDKEIIVFDSRAIDNPPIRPPDGVVWQHIPVSEGKYVHVSDEVDPHCGLTFQQPDNVLPFIRFPRAQSLNILSHTGHQAIIKALNACEKLKRTSLVRSDHKHMFGDYGTKVMYTCTGVQVSRRSRKVLEAAPYMEKLPGKQWGVLMRLMRGAERFPSR
jgi:hypothetical protein